MGSWSTQLLLCFSVMVVIIGRVAEAHSCPACDPMKCRPAVNCVGGVVKDICRCCDECARQRNESCGGHYELQCDQGLICVVPATRGPSDKYNLEGICLESKWSCANPLTYRGCNLMEDRCLCTSVVACEDPKFQFSEAKDCYKTLATKFVYVKDKGVLNCTDECPAIEDPECPVDSILAVGKTAPGECCRKPGVCECSLDHCHLPDCAPGYQRILEKSATGKPGECCDVYQCQYAGNCSQVQCPAALLTCPDDSFQLPSLTRVNQCCSIPQGCACLPGACKPVECPDGFTSEIIKEGNDKPGSCCTEFRCVKDPTCVYKGVKYSTGEKWSLDHCNTCECNNGISFCDSVRCPAISDCGLTDIPTGECCPVCTGCTYHGSHYKNNEKWMPDKCTSCWCENGKVSCQAEMCGTAAPMVVTIPSGCPSLSNCEKDCSHGFKVDRDGCPICKCARCRKMKECTKKCPYGLQVNDKDCTICKCRDFASVNATVNPVSATVTPDLSSGVSCLTSDAKIYDDGESWHDGCRQCFCNNGVEMCALITCPVPKCEHPTIYPNHCCPSCLDDSMTPAPSINVTVCHSVDGHYHVEGETWKLDNCTHCICHMGQVLCSAARCPPVPCDKPVWVEGGCCPVCAADSQKGSNKATPPVPCVVSEMSTRADGESWRVSVCQSCNCIQGKIECFSEKCQSLNCDKPILRKNQCCPVCIDGKAATTCKFEGVLYGESEVWSVNECKICSCNNGTVNCKEKVCPTANCEKQKQITVPGQCCPICAGNTPKPPLVTSGKPLTPKFDTDNDDDVFSTIGIDPDYETHGEWDSGWKIIVVLSVVILALILAVAVLLACCFRQKKKLELQRKEEKLNSNLKPTRPKSTNLEYQGSFTNYKSHYSPLYPDSRKIQDNYNVGYHNSGRDYRTNGGANLQIYTPGGLQSV